MGKAYIGVNNISKNISKIYVGVDGIAREIKKGYVGVDGIAKLFFISESGEIILPPSVGETSYTGESLVYSGWDANNNYLICKRFDDFLFVSSNTYNYGRLQGLYVVNMKTGVASQITSSGENYIYALELQKNRYLISCSSIAFLYNGETETATQVSVGNTFNHMVDVGDKVIIRSSVSNVNLYLYDKQSERFTSLGLPYHDVKSTSQGVFAYALYGTSTNYKRLYKFSSSTGTFNEVLFLNTNGTTASVQATYTGRIYEEKSGVVWYCVNSENSTPYFFTGTYFSPNWDGMTNQACFGYKNTPIFKLGDDECFTANKKIWVFKGNKIEVKLPHINSSNIVTSTYAPVHVEKYGRTYITQNIASTIETFNTAFYIWKGTEIEYKATTLKIPTVALEIQDKVFLTGGGATYEITGGITNYGLTPVGAFNITAVFEVDGEIYAKNNTTLYKYLGTTFISLASASAGNSMCTVVAGTFINVIGYYSTYNTGSESAIKTYNLITGEVKTLSTTVRYRLGQTSFISTNSKKVHDVFGNSINSYGLNIYSVTDYLTRGASATYSNHNIFGEVTNTKLSLLYEVPGEWEYKTVKWDTGEDVYETKIVKGGYLEEIEVEKEGFDFVGWYKDGEKFDFTQPVNGNITLVAEWEELTWEEIDYIESSGTQYIDTKFIPNQNTRVEVRFLFTENLTSNAWIFGARTTYQQNDFGFCALYPSLIFFSAFGAKEYSGVSVQVSKEYIVNKNKNVTTINGSSNTLSTSTFTSPTTLALFGNHEPSGFKGLSKIMLYYAKIYDNDTLIRDFIPIKLNTGKYALLDKVNNQVYRNAGTGEFIGG